jgi:hypothetical protein
MYRTIRRRFEVGNIKLVTVINTIGTTISLFIVLWIYCFVSDIKLQKNIDNGMSYLNQELTRCVISHGPITSILALLLILSKYDEKERIFCFIVSIGSLWLLFTTKSLWPSLLLGFCLGLVLPMDSLHSSKSIQYPYL